MRSKYADSRTKSWKKDFSITKIVEGFDLESTEQYQTQNKLFLLK